MVCTGNICRSPVMERLLTARLSGRPDAGTVEVRSAGVHGLTGWPMTPEAAETLVAAGGDPEGFVARRLDAAMVREADLVLGAAREHRAVSVTLDPRSASRTMTLRELVRLLGPVRPEDVTGGTAAERFASVQAAAVANRGLLPRGHAADDDIADPYGGTPGDYASAMAVIAASIEAILTLL